MAAPDRAGFDVNNIHTLSALSSTDGVTPVSLWADPTTHAVVMSGGAGGGGTQYTTGAVVPGSPIGSALVFGSGANWQYASTSNGLPVSTINGALETGGNLATIVTNTARSTDNTGTPTTGLPVMGVDTATGTPHLIRTDTGGRMKISHGQPAASTATLGALNAIAAIASDGFSDANFYFSGTTVQTVTFEQSPDSTDGTNGTWYPVLASNQGVVVAAATTAALTAVHTYRVSAPGAAWIHAKTTAYTSGSSSVQMVITTAMAQSQVTNTQSGTSTVTATMTSTTIAAPAVAIAGLSIGKIVSAATTNATSQKATQARLLGWNLTNTTASAKYVHLHNLTTAPVVGTSVPITHIVIAPNSTNSYAGTQGITFSTGLSYSITGAAGDLDATAVAAGDVVGSLFYV